MAEALTFQHGMSQARIKVRCVVRDVAEKATATLSFCLAGNTPWSRSSAVLSGFCRTSGFLNEIQASKQNQVEVVGRV